MTPEQKAALQRAAIRRAQQRRNAAPSQSPRPQARPAANEPDWRQRLWENIVGDDDPNSHNFGEKVGSAINKAGEALTFGILGDESSAAAESLIPGVNYEDRRDHYRKQEEVLERDSPRTALAADVGGALAGVAIPGMAIGTLARGASLPARIGASSTTAATSGATYGAMEGEGFENRKSRAISGGGIAAMTGAAAVPVGALVQKAADNGAVKKLIRDAIKGAPTSDALKAAGKKAYDEIDQSGVQIKAESFNNARKAILDNLKSKTAYSSRPGGQRTTPNTSAVVDDMASMSDEMAGAPGAALPLRELDGLRRQAGAAAGNFTNKSDQAAGMEIINGLDDYLARLGPDDVVAGDVEALKTALPKARDIWARMSRSQMIDDAIDNAGNYQSGGSSGIRNQFASILRNKKKSAGFSDAERKIMRQVVQGSAPKQILDLMGGGMGQLLQITAGGVTGGIPGALGAAALGRAAKRGSEAVTTRAAEQARAAIASGKLRGPLPKADDSRRRLVENLLRRIGANSQN